MSTNPNLTKSLEAIMITAALVETLLYGVHFVLFCICIFILVRSKRPSQWIILVSAIVMFALSTADIAITFRFASHNIIDVFDHAGHFSIPVLKSFMAKDLIFVSNNFMAELTLSYRCYMIWGRPTSLLVIMGFLILSDTIWGYLSLGSIHGPVLRFLPVYLWSVFAINILISGITVGRIFWVAHIAQPHLGHRNLRHFHFIIAALLETSVVYSSCVLSYLILVRQPQSQLIVGITGTRIVAIMPTLLIVQVGLLADRTAGDANDCERPGTRSIVLDTIVITNHDNRDTLGLMGMQTRDTQDSGSL